MKTYLKVSVLILVLVFIWRCTPNNDTLNEFKEPNKNITGSWQIVKASRNSADLYKDYDFTKFRLNFNEDNTYSIENYLPFLVKENGQFTLDDPQYPFNILFTPENGDSKRLSFLFPILNGERYLTLTFSPGCRTNTYTYVFKRVNE